MDAKNVIFLDGKKFMWDGHSYETESQAKETIEKYQKDSFETHLDKNNVNYFVYTRRLAKADSVKTE
jgi:hypothetical protein